MATNGAPTSDEVARHVVASVRARLPQKWKVAETIAPRRGPLRPDVEIEIDAPDGGSARLIVELKQVLERRDVSRAIEQTRSMTTRATDVPVVAARYLSPPVRDALAEGGLSYVAGPAVLLIAKLHKLQHRIDNPSRLDNKDAHDIYRLLRAIDTDVLVSATGDLKLSLVDRRVERSDHHLGVVNQGRLHAARAAHERGREW